MFSSNGLSAADVAAVMNGNNCCNGGMGYGFGEGWWVIIILMALWGGFGRGGAFGGYGGNAGGNCGCGCNSAVATVGDIQRGFDNQGVTNKLNGLENGLCDGFYAVNTSILNSTNTIQNAIQQASTANLQNTYALQNTMLCRILCSRIRSPICRTPMPCLGSLRIAAVRIVRVRHRFGTIWLPIPVLCRMPSRTRPPL